MFKRASCILFICTLLISINVYANENSKLIVGSAEAEKGDKIVITVDIENNPGFAAMILSLSYDSTFLIPEAIVGGDVIKNAEVVSNIQQGGDLTKYNPLSFTIINPYDFTNDGTIFYVTFNVVEDFEDDIGLVLSYKNSDISNQKYEDVNLQIVNGNVKYKKKDQDGEQQNFDNKSNTQKGFVNTSNEICVFVDNEKVQFDQQPIIQDDRTLVPMRAIFEKLGAKVEWDEATKTALAEKDGTTIQFQINNKFMRRNNEIVILDVPAQLLNSRTLVPIRAISESLNCRVDWIEETRAVIIQANK